MDIIDSIFGIVLTALITAGVAYATYSLAKKEARDELKDLRW